MAKSEQPIPSLVRSVNLLLQKDPHRLLSVELTQFSHPTGGAFSGYAVNSKPDGYSTLFNADGSRFDEVRSTQSDSQADLDALGNMLRSGNFELVPRDSGFAIFPKESNS